MAVSLNLPQLITNFLKFQENVNSFSPHSLRAYALDLSQAYRNYTNTLSEAEFVQITKKSLYKWAPLSPASRNRKISTLKSFTHWLYQEKWMSEDLSHQLVCPKVQRKIPHFISVDEALSCLRCFDNPPLMNDLLRENKKALFLLLYGCGLRISEACQLSWDRVDFNNRRILILGKGQKERVISAPNLVFTALKKLKADATSDFIFTLATSPGQPLNTRIGYEWIKQIGIAAHMNLPLHPHALRHSFATHLLSGGSNLRILQKILGHESLRATEIYTHLSLDQLTQTVDRFHPLGNNKKL